MRPFIQYLKLKLFDFSKTKSNDLLIPVNHKQKLGKLILKCERKHCTKTTLGVPSIRVFQQKCMGFSCCEPLLLLPEEFG